MRLLSMTFICALAGCASSSNDNVSEPLPEDSQSASASTIDKIQSQPEVVLDLPSEFRRIQLGYQTAARQYRTQLRKAKTADEKQQLEGKAPDLAGAVQSAINLYAGHESEPSYLDMASWIIRTSEDQASIASVLDVVKEHHMASESIDGFLGNALAQNVPIVNSFVAELSRSGSSAASMVARLLIASTLDPESDRERQIQLLQSVVEFDGDVRYGEIDYKQIADGQLFSLLRLQVGAKVPDIEGPDVDGIHFKLSDYLGKVIMLDFWGDW